MVVSWPYSGLYPTRMEYIWVAGKELGGQICETCTHDENGDHQYYIWEMRRRRATFNLRHELRSATCPATEPRRHTFALRVHPQSTPHITGS